MYHLCWGIDVIHVVIDLKVSYWVIGCGPIFYLTFILQRHCRNNPVSKICDNSFERKLIKWRMLKA